MRDTIESRIARQEQRLQQRRTASAGHGVIIIPRDMPREEHGAYVEAIRQEWSAAGATGGFIVLPAKGASYV